MSQSLRGIEHEVRSLNNACLIHRYWQLQVPVLQCYKQMCLPLKTCKMNVVPLSKVFVFVFFKSATFSFFVRFLVICLNHYVSVCMSSELCGCVDTDRQHPLVETLIAKKAPLLKVNRLCSFVFLLCLSHPSAFQLSIMLLGLGVC